MNIEMLETNMFIKENLKLLWNGLIDMTYVILIDSEDIELKKEKYNMYLHNYGINHCEFCVYDKSFFNNYHFEHAIHHKIYETALHDNFKNIFIMEENYYFEQDKEVMRRILENLCLVKKKYIFQNQNIDFIYLNSIHKRLTKSKFHEYHSVYIINLDCVNKIYKNETCELNCFCISLIHSTTVESTNRKKPIEILDKLNKLKYNVMSLMK